MFFLESHQFLPGPLRRDYDVAGDDGHGTVRVIQAVA